MLPTYPSHLFPRPFADHGIYQTIPAEKPATGRASFKEGFPTETQLPLSGGGIAPNRPDCSQTVTEDSICNMHLKSGRFGALPPPDKGNCVPVGKPSLTEALAVARSAAGIA